MSDTPGISTMVYKVLEVLEREAAKSEHADVRQAAERIIDEGLELLKPEVPNGASTSQE